MIRDNVRVNIGFSCTWSASDEKKMRRKPILTSGSSLPETFSHMTRNVRFNLHPDPLCRVCNEINDISHILLRCQKYASVRVTLWRKLNIVSTNITYDVLLSPVLVNKNQLLIFVQTLKYFDIDPFGNKCFGSIVYSPFRRPLNYHWDRFDTVKDCFNHCYGTTCSSFFFGTFSTASNWK
ncbi:hypothetical protein AVEN_20330-1 [Araneus ventricosus]|uniref:Reverse transcriptase zinc-binding domain-containing protein n=1 Tax=Araneus ventricosus TaxID=182803 RepID=A0A4Y2IRJ5_ARAVE|nr:hypothetical protein AVEN_20330-1 [Araneus ventricosus]